MTIAITITNAGYAALVNGRASGTNAIEISSFGISQVAVAAVPSLTALPNEMKRVASLSGGTVSPDTIHVVLQDLSADAYSMRAFALYLSDGTLFAVYGQTDPILIKTARSDALLATDIQFADIDATSITFGDTNFFNPQATETVAGIAEIATQDEAKAGVDDMRFVTPAKAKGAVLSWLGYTPVRQGGGAYQLANTVFIGWDGSRLRAQVDATDQGPIWTAATDGAGSGLDADLLDGLDGSFYTDIRARLGYTPANRAGDTFTGDVAISHGGNPSLILNSAGVMSATLVAQSDGQVVLYRNGSALWNSEGSYFNMNLPVLMRQGQRVWDAGNDGSGSGLDADLLDGVDGATYARRDQGVAFAGTVETAGDFRLGRQTDQWGYILRPNVPGYRNMALAADGGNALDSVNIVSYSLTRLGWKVWDAGNDGSGSGLDADMLDGQDGGYYANIPERLGYTPANRAGDSFDGEVSALRFRARSNGDGQAISIGDDAWIGDANMTNTAVVRGQNNPNAGYIAFGNTFAGLGCNPDDGTLRYAGNPLWHAGNDGSGSGLDADMLDGLDSTAFARTLTSSQLGSEGHRVHYDGFKECWGTVTVPAGSTVFVPMPVEHTEWVNVGLGTPTRDSSNAQYNTGIVGRPDASGFSIRNWENTALTVDWNSRGK